MLKSAYLRKLEVQNLFAEAQDSGRLAYYTTSTYYEFDKSIDNNDYYKTEKISVNDSGEIIGFIACNTGIGDKICDNLHIVRFNDTMSGRKLFILDLLKFLIDLHSRGFKKLEFNVNMSNSGAMKLYDKFVNIVGGEIVGVRRRSMISPNNLDKMHDMKLYDVHFEESIVKIEELFMALKSKFICHARYVFRIEGDCAYKQIKS